MQKRTALAATVLLLGAQFALVQNSRGHDDVRFENHHHRLGSGELADVPGHRSRGGSVRAFEVPGALASR